MLCKTRVYLSCRRALQTAPSQTLQKSDKGLLLMCQGTAVRGFTAPWLLFKEFELERTTHPLYLRYPVKNQNLRTASVTNASAWRWLNDSFYFQVKENVGCFHFSLCQKLKNKGSCVRSGVCWKPSLRSRHAERQQLLAWYGRATEQRGPQR